MKIFITLFIFCLTLASNAQVQKIKIKNINNFLLEYTSITDIENGKFVISDSLGFANVEINRKYKFSHAGYYDSVFYINKDYLIIILRERITDLEPILIKQKNPLGFSELENRPKKSRKNTIALTKCQYVYRFKPKTNNGIFKLNSFNFYISNYKELKKNDFEIEFRFFYSTKMDKIYELQHSNIYFNLNKANYENTVEINKKCTFFNFADIEYFIVCIIIPKENNDKILFTSYSLPLIDDECNALYDNVSSDIDTVILKLNNKKSIYFKEFGQFKHKNYYLPIINFKLAKYEK